LVKLQFKIAEGEPLPFTQDELSFRGHAVEIRVYAEDPANNFLPDIGRLEVYTRPNGNGIRVDDGFEQGMDVPFYYDPMIAKLICKADTREAAIEKMIRAIDEYEITGLTTTLGFCKYVMQHEAFRSGNFDTGFVSKYFTPDVLNPSPDEDEITIASLLAVNALNTSSESKEETKTDAPAVSKWKLNRL
jgi:acetyl-CoA carboxylase, biotin carboxylase subunit